MITSEPSRTSTRIQPDYDDPENYARIGWMGQKVKWETLWQGVYVDGMLHQLPQGVKIDLQEYLKDRHDEQNKGGKK